MLLLLASVLMLPVAVQAKPSANYQNFLNNLWKDAAARGIPRSVFDKAFAGITPDPKVLTLTRKQPEFSETTADYINRRVSESRVAGGRAKAREWAQTLEAIERTYGVDRFVVLSIWGNETNFGGFLGGHSVIRALTTLAYAGFRAPYFRNELLNALEILARGDTDPRHMIGSWAGAMGHTQFMPSSFKSFAVDFNGDGRRDIWTTIPDALASTANYLRRMGWRPGETWGYEVLLPQSFDYARAARMDAAPVSAWVQMGARRASGQGFPRDSDQARLYLPGGAGGPAFLLLPNFNVIKRYNNSNNYALAVGHLADRARGGGPFVTPWPLEQSLPLDQRIEIQNHLVRRGYTLEKIDGVMGSQTRDAIRAYQVSAGITADGHPSPALLERLRRGP